jgi:DNA-directed RNA polymerase subunit RPC12/RpoP
MATEMTFIVEYRCPRCDAALEARSGEAFGWLRCPSCGRASLPPEHMRTPRPRTRPSEPPGDDVVIIGPDPTGADATDRSPFRPGSFRRIAGASALFLSLLIALLSLLEQDRIGAMVFTVIAVLCLVFSAYPIRPRSA